MIGESEDIVFSSAGEMVAFFKDCYKQGAFFTGINGILSIDPA